MSEPSVDDLLEALVDLEQEAATQATQSSATADWWGKVGYWLSAIVYSLSGATALLAFVSLRATDQVATTTLGVTALFLALLLCTTLRLRPGAKGEAATVRFEALRRFAEVVRRFRRTEARFLDPSNAWARFNSLADMLGAIKAGRLDSASIYPAGDL